uniref:Cobalamin-binding protein n=1 Tax=candidate division WOR-3 bacterium TaxID=2052148 RepID=A0A7C4GH06_UNCW3
MEHIYSRLADAVVAMSPDQVAQLARQVIAEGRSAEKAITQGLAAGMRRMGEKFAAKECFVPEVLLASKAMYAGFDILKAHITSEPQSRGRVVLGVVQGDIHDIGKNIVKVMAQAAGYDVMDLGRNVPVATFVHAAGESGAALVGVSSLMTTTMPRMGQVVEALDKAGLRKQVRVVVGGAPVSAEFSRRIGADGYAPDAHGAVLEFERLIGA